MSFNTWEYAIFLILIFVAYWYAFKSIKSKNLLLLVASYFFYGWWDYRFLALIVLSSLTDYYLGLAIERHRRKIYLIASLTLNLGLLGYFKYVNFFIENFIDAFQFLGLSLHISTLSIILPVGISFYTFQTLSYTIDVYREKIKAEKNLLNFMAFVSFFPQLVAGPIERASNLLPQFKAKRSFEPAFATQGLRQILGGLFKKMVIADNCALVVNPIFENPDAYPGSALLVASVFFAFQIYGDFSGYSDIAIGTAKLFGIRLMQNFNYPYFSRDIAEFWRRWHISLSTWFRDYLYIPLGGSKGATGQQIRNVFIIFLVSGFWHGANWTFIAWGALNAFYFLPLMLMNTNRKHLSFQDQKNILPSLGDLMRMGITFGLATVGWIFFRADSISDAFYIIQKIGSPSLLQSPGFRSQILLSSSFILILLMLEWLNRKRAHFLDIANLTTPVRWGYYLFIFTCLFLFGATQSNSFIYFQF